MDLQSRLDFVLELARQIDLDLRFESLGGEGGGLCALRGRRVLFVDQAADLETRYERTIAALAGLPELEQRFILPEVRADLDRARPAAKP